MFRVNLAVFVVSLVLTAISSAQVRKPPAIQAESVPEIPESIANKLDQYQNYRSSAFEGWAPDGSGMLIATRFGNTNQLFFVREPGGRREQVTFFKEPASGRCLPSGQDTWAGELLVSINPGGSENYQIYHVSTATGNSTLLTDGKSRNGMGPVRVDGSRMVIMSNQRNGKDIDIYVADPRKPNSMVLVHEGSGSSWQAVGWSKDGFRLLLIKYISINESYPFVLDLITRKATPIPLATDKPAAYTDLKFSKDGNSVYLATDARGEFRELAKVDLQSGTYEWLSEKVKWNVESIELAGEQVIFTVNKEGQSLGYLAMGSEYEPHELFKEEGSITALEYSDKRQALAYTLTTGFGPADVFDYPYLSSVQGGHLAGGGLPLGESARSLSLMGMESALGGGAIQGVDYVLIDRSGKPTSKATRYWPGRWTFSETGGIPASTFAKPTLVHFESFDKQRIPAFVYKPANIEEGKKLPVVIEIHGGPESQYRPRFSPLGQYIVNELGFTLVCPNVRGSDGYGKSYLLMDNGAKREDSVKDIGALLDWIKAQPDLDASRVAVYGGSYGGYMVLASLTNFPDRIKAGVDIVGIANFQTFLERTASYRRDQRRAEYGDERDQQMKAVFDRINPTANVDKINSALLVIHGKNDPRVPFFEAEQIAAKVRARNRPVWTVFADNEGHGFAKKENRDYMNYVVVAFLKEHLK